MAGVSWANIEFVAALLGALIGWVILDRPHREGRAARRQRRDDEDRAAAIRRTDLEVLHRHYRTSVRYYQAGHDPGELSPPSLPGRSPAPPGAPTARRSPSSSSNQSPSM